MKSLSCFFIIGCFLILHATSLKPSSKKLASSGGAKKKLVCYYTNWSQYRPKIGQFTPEDIPPHLCTHILFAFGWMKKHKIAAFEPTDETKQGKKGLYERVIELKKKNPELKILLAVGGWSFGTQRFKEMATSRYNRQLFIFSALSYLRKRNFDGLDLDWEFPRGSDDKRNFVALLKELREAFEEESKETRKPKLLLTVAVSAGVEAVQTGYDVPAVAAYVDFINIMSYDFHGKWESQTGHNSPLYPPANETNWRKQLCVDFGVKLWERLGAPKEKIVVGMATYGRSFTLANKESPGYNVPSRGGGKAGEYTREEGFLAYYEICEMLKKGARYVWDDVQKVPYAHLDDQWVGFDDERSLRIKSQWVMENDYGGAMIWTVDMDDFRGVCKGRSFALISAIKDELEGKGSSSVADNILITQASQRRLVTGNDLPATTRTKAPKKIEASEDEEDGEPETTVNKDETNARVVCYFTNWAQKRPGLGRFDPEHIDPELCSHVLLAFATIEDNLLAASDQGEAPDHELYAATVSLKQKNPSLRVMLSVGGWMLGSKPFRHLTTSSYRKMTFIFQVIDYLRQHRLDGLDLDWEFPKGAQDKERLTGLIKDLREAFDGEARNADKPRLLLSTTVPASFEAVSAGYNVAEINKYVDMINVLSYDFHGAWERHVGHPSPLLPLEAESAYQKKLTVDYSAAELVRKGAAKEKLVIGMATYGRTFTLANSSLTDIGAPARDGGRPGPYTRESGFLAFYEICELLKSGATLVWDNEQMVPYAFVDDQWVGFDDQRSIKLKVQWLKQSGYGGVMIWAVDLDDFRGSCLGKAYPLLRAVREELKGYQVANLEAQPSDVHSATSQLLDKDEVVCDEADGHITYHLDKKDCTKYYMCEGKRRHHMPCPNQLVFNLQESVCDWPENVPDCYKAQSAAANDRT